jgi:UDP-N-acetylmuramoyl-L-alanyl-D-glutamate--2,6-diaminopimelate ligase
MSMNESIPFSMSLSRLLEGLVTLDTDQDREISGLALDSRRVQTGDLFFACSGGVTHGVDYALHAVEQGAAAIVYDVQSQSRIDTLMHVLTGPLPGKLPLFAVADLQEHIGEIAARFYRQPSRDQFVIGITGTNGKTSCSHYLAQALARRMGDCGLIGTLGYGLYGRLAHGLHTTPDALQLQTELASIHSAGARHVVMEVSSHGLDQRRVNGVAFDAAVLTNLSHDHLDYHGSLDSYAAAKQRLFRMPGLRYAVINQDDTFGRRLISQLSTPPTGQAPAGLKVLSYGFDQAADVRATARRFDADGFELQVSTPWGDGVLSSRLLGRFNASNLLAALATLLLMDLPLDQVLVDLGQTRAVNGRMEHFGGSASQPLVVVDYAHTPDALQQVLETLREHCRGQLWCVFGCGGDRDRDKRPRMGAIAEQIADRLIITDDNPRHEQGAAIIQDILAGILLPAQVIVNQDRAAAISYAVQSAKAGDVVLVAGKGHEEYQLVGDQILPFSDRQQVRHLLGEVA